MWVWVILSCLVVPVAGLDDKWLGPERMVVCHWLSTINGIHLLEKCAAYCDIWETCSAFLWDGYRCSIANYREDCQEPIEYNMYYLDLYQGSGSGGISSEESGSVPVDLDDHWMGPTRVSVCRWLFVASGVSSLYECVARCNNFTGCNTLSWKDNNCFMDNGMKECIGAPWYDVYYTDPELGTTTVATARSTLTTTESPMTDISTTVIPATTTKPPSKSPTTTLPTIPVTTAVPRTESPTTPLTESPSKSPTTTLPTIPVTTAVPQTESPTTPLTETPSKSPTTTLPTIPVTTAVPHTESPTTPLTEPPSETLTTALPTITVTTTEPPSESSVTPLPTTPVTTAEPQTTLIPTSLSTTTSNSNPNPDTTLASKKRTPTTRPAVVTRITFTHVPTTLESSLDTEFPASDGDNHATIYAIIIIVCIVATVAYVGIKIMRKKTNARTSPLIDVVFDTTRV